MRHWHSSCDLRIASDRHSRLGIAATVVPHIRAFSNCQHLFAHILSINASSPIWEEAPHLRRPSFLRKQGYAMTIRRQTVEHPSGTLKAWMGSTYFPDQGPRKGQNRDELVLLQTFPEPPEGRNFSVVSRGGEDVELLGQ
ncbi:hypothetical protein DBIPINDM_001022 [Mesorhizobium sp. AR02]|uniref:hypothetical protein n=1 Tax=Mesorhizobium sp. AR02 TaxID=2865837 RepID=UPI00215FFD9E|nr:hypothetical protein [Mesorhizobium sp. AR02]UVK57271.1 hypothetical protein DBIPINDM_001022 [Mesorhizobium sp. AR02]